MLEVLYLIISIHGIPQGNWGYLLVFISSLSNMQRALFIYMIPVAKSNHWYPIYQPLRLGMIWHKVNF